MQFIIVYVLILAGSLLVFGQEDDSLTIPEDAQGRPDLPKIIPQPDWDNVCFCSYGECGKEQTCKKQTYAACFHAMEEVYNRTSKQMETHHKYGCATLESGSRGSYLTCKSYLVPQVPPKSIACCYEGHLCNMKIDPPPYVNQKEWEDLNYIPLGGGTWWQFILITSFALGLGLLVLYFVHKFKYGKAKEKTRLMSQMENDELLDLDSGSGSGSKALNQRTVAQDLEMLETIGRGRYGDVRKALYKDSLVAAKTFSTTDEESWKNERDIYQTNMINHKNILQFVAADIGSEDSITHMLLITDYHVLGSLCDYLRRDSVLTVKEALDLAHSTICGIEHLHSFLQGTGSHRKPEIAHRDIKSKNIIVKREGVCCIADFGLAVRFEDDRLIPEKVNIQVGTKRYMAPEVLSKSLSPHDFTQFKMSDMYSYALVVWEILRRVEWTMNQEGTQEGTASDSSGYGGSEVSETASPRIQHMQKPSLDLSTKAKPYVPPYEGMVDNDPALEDMRRVVCDENRRPPLEKAWQENDSPLQRLTQLMVECWHSTPSCRHTALKFKMELGKIIANLNQKAKQEVTNPPTNNSWTGVVNEQHVEEVPLPRSPPHTKPASPPFQYPPNVPKFSINKPISSDSGLEKSRGSSSQKSFRVSVNVV